MEVRVLGPVEVWRGGQHLVLGRRQQRLILGILALDTNHAVPRDRLIELLWGPTPPPRARAALQTRISELRSTLSLDRSHLVETATPGTPVPGTAVVETAVVETAVVETAVVEPAVLETRGDSYLLRMPSTGVDLHTFRHLVTEAHAAASDAAARELFVAALALWRGPALGGALAGEPHAALCHSLDSARLMAQEELFDIEMRMDRPHAVIDQIVDAFAANPHRERLAMLALTALRRTGRTAEAIRTYDRWRRWLADELGIDPSREMQQLYLSLLRGQNERPAPSTASGGAETSPAPNATEVAAVPRTLPPDISDFTGRDAELAELVEHLTRREGGRPAVVALSGRGGVGKTALTIHAAHRVSDEFPDGQLYAGLRGLGDEGPARPSEILGRLLRALGVVGPAIPESMDERTDLYRGLLVDKRVLVVLDNAASDDQIAPLIPSGPDCAVLINGRARLGVTFGAPALALDVLPADQAIDLVASIAGPARVSAEPDAALDLAHSCGYLPLALRIAGAKLAAKPHWSVRKLVGLLQDERDQLDQFSYGQLDVRTSIALSYAGLDAEVRRLLKRLGDMRLPDVSVFGAAALMDITPQRVEVLLEQLFDAQLLDFAHHDRAGRPRYRLHDLVRLFATERAAIEDPPAELAAARGRLFGAWLSAGEAMHRHVRGGLYQHVDGGAPRHPLDDETAAVLDREPLRWFETERKNFVAAVGRAAKDGQATVAWDLTCLMSPMMQIRRHLDDWWVVLTYALTAARQAGDLRGQGAVWFQMAMAHSDRREHERAEQLFRDATRAFAQVGDPLAAAVADVFTGTVERFRGEHDRPEQRYRDALPVLRAHGDRGTEAYTLRSLGQLCAGRGDADTATDYYEQAMRIYRDINARQGQAQTLAWHSMLHLEQGRLTDAQAGFERALEIARGLMDPAGEILCLRGLGLCYRQLDKRDKAEESLSEALRLAQQRYPTFLEALVQSSIASSA